MTQKRVALMLVLLVVAASAVLVWLVREPGGVVGSAVTTAESADATVVSAAVADTVRDVAAEAATAAYSYSWETLAEDKAAARDLMTAGMQDRYDRTMAGVATASRRDHTVVSAEVVDTGLVTATATYARVLVFVNQSTSGDDLDEPTLDLDRVLVSLQRVGGEWRLSELDAL
jgi:Mce-associated membrane protein